MELSPEKTLNFLHVLICKGYILSFNRPKYLDMPSPSNENETIQKRHFIVDVYFYIAQD